MDTVFQEDAAQLKFNSPFIWETKRSQKKKKSIIESYQKANLGRTADSSIDKCRIEGKREERREKIGLNTLEKGHHDA